MGKKEGLQPKSFGDSDQRCSFVIPYYDNMTERKASSKTMPDVELK